MRTVEGRWRTDATEQAEAAMAARLDGVRSELEALRNGVADARHPWTVWFALAVIGTLTAAFVGFSSGSVPGFMALLADGGGSIWTFRRKRAADRLLVDARAPMDALIRERVLDVEVLDEARETLEPFIELGAFGGFDDIASLTRVRHDARDLLDARLTREETYTTTDSQGNTRTETRTVTVFDGILFALPFPDVSGHERVVITSSGRPRPGGRFARRDPAGKRRKFAKLSVASPKFSRGYTLWADDPVTGHLVADPDRVMRWLLMMDDLKEMLGRKRPPKLMALITDGRMWVVMDGIDGLRVENFHEGPKLDRELLGTHRVVSIPAAMARHLRL